MNREFCSGGLKPVAEYDVDRVINCFVRNQILDLLSLTAMVFTC